VDVCPVDCIIPDTNHPESKEELQRKYQELIRKSA
jgi:hypothetical protein